MPVASFTATKLRWLRDAEPDNAARVAAVALPHDWLTWRLAGYGPAGESPLGPDLSALTTDRSDASGTGYWSAATGEYDRELLVRALGHDVVVPRVLAPDERAGFTTVEQEGIPAGIALGAGAGDNAGAALGLGAAVGDVVVSIGTSGTVFAVTDTPAADASGAVAGFADASGRLPSPGRDAKRGAGRRCHRRAARGRPRRVRRSGPRGRAGCRRRGARAVLLG